MTRLLVVDDEPSVRKLIKRFFESRGFDVATADNGIQGWQMARDMGPEIVLSDVSMPEMDGYELTRTIRRNPVTATIPVILLSAHREADAMVAGYECGADDYVPKPVDMEVLRHKIEALMRRAVTSTAAAIGPSTGKLICVTSAKGGVGVSTLTANLAVLLCRRNETVCAYDLNLEHGDLAVFLDIQPKLSIVDLARELAVATPDALPWDDFLTRHPAGPKMLAAPAHPHDATSVSEEQVDTVTARLRELHDYVLVDLPPSYGDVALGIFEKADRVVVVTSPEITALRRTRELLGVLGGLGVSEEKVTLVLNQVVEVAGIDARRTEAFLKRPVTVTVPHGGAPFTEAVTMGRPVVLSNANGATARAVVAIDELARQL